MKSGMHLLQAVVLAKYNRVHFNCVRVSKDFYESLMADESMQYGSSFLDIDYEKNKVMMASSGVPLVAGPKDQVEPYILMQGD